MKNRKGFTLIELLVVVAIIALLIALLLPTLAKAKEEAKLTKCQANLHAIAIALASYNTQNKDQMPSVQPVYFKEWNNGNQLMGWSDQVYVDGNFKQNTNWKGMGGAGGDGTAANNNASWHYPTMGYGMLQCPNHGTESQLDSNGNPSDARSLQGYCLSWAAWSGFYNPANNGGPYIVESRNLNPGHIIAAEGNVGMGNQGAYWVPAHMDKASVNPSYKKYGVFERHQRAGVRGANYLFADSHVEYSSDYGWAPSPSSYRASMNWVSGYRGPATLPNGLPNKMATNRIWAHGQSDN